MKLNKILTYVLLLLPAFALQSCLKDQEDIFDSSASARVEKYLSDTQKVLQSSQYGWALENFPDRNQSYGGYTYTLKFQGDTVITHSEQDHNNAVVSLYSMKNVDGPVLSFDTHNKQLHDFATPNSNSNVGKGGDFEFVIDSVGDDLIKVHGNRNQNTMYLRKLTEPADNYIAKVEQTAANFGLLAATGTLAGQNVQIVFDRDNRQATISDGTNEVQAGYCVTTSGIRFYKPVTLGGTTVSELTYSDNDLSLTGNNSQLAGIYDPSIITNAIGSISSDDNAFTRTLNNLPHLDQFNITTSASWLTATVSGSSIQLAAGANTTGDLRSAKVIVTSKLAPQVKSSFTVTQMNLTDIIGNYKFYYTDLDNKKVTATAEIAQSGSALKLVVKTKLLGGDFTLTFPAEFDQATGSLALQAGATLYNQKLKLTTSSGKEIQGYMISAFEFGDGYVTYKNVVSALMPFSHDDQNGTYAQMGNLKVQQSVLDYQVESLDIYFAAVQNPTSEDEVYGMVDQWKNCTLIKTTAVSPAKPAFLLPVSTKAAASQPRFKSLAGYKIKK